MALVIRTTVAHMATISLKAATTMESSRVISLVKAQEVILTMALGNSITSAQPIKLAARIHYQEMRMQMMISKSK